MSLVLNRTNVTKMSKPRSEIERVRVRVYQRFWLGRGSRSYHRPFPAGELGFQKTMAENREDRDRIEDEDKQHHGVGHRRINSVIGDGYHDLEANPVKQRRYPVELRVPWSPKPIGSARRWRACRICLFDVIKILHLQSLSIWKIAQVHPTGNRSALLTVDRSPMAAAKLLPPRFLLPSIGLCFTVLTTGRTSNPGHGRNEEEAAQSRFTSQSFCRSGCRNPSTCAPPGPSDRP